MIKNLVLFKVGWLACVVGAAYNAAWLGAAVVALVVVEHLRSSVAPKREALLLAAAGAMGLVWETALVSLELIAYPSGTLPMGIAPYWIVAMWVLFATTINAGLKWVKQHWLIAALAGGLGGPLAFAGGEGLGAVTFTDSLTLLVVGLGWALLLPVLAECARRWNGLEPVPLTVEVRA